MTITVTVTGTAISASIAETTIDASVVQSPISVQINGETQTFGVVGAYVLKTSDYTPTSLDYTINCSGTFSITLPTAVGMEGRVYNIKNSGAGLITLLTTSGQTIDGDASGIIMLNQYENLTVQSDGANWMVI